MGVSKVQKQPVRRNGERGFALLFVFALAGIAALMLYNEMPRAVFESQRAKEELLVGRGQEYQRGIQLYYRKLRKYPATIEDLEKANGIRFLRRRYVDPFSGKDDWRFVHINAAGQFSDSKVIKPPTAAQTGGLSSSITAEPKRDDANDPSLKRRASDVSAVDIGGAGQVSAAPPDPNGLPPVNGPSPYQGRTMNDPQSSGYNAAMGGVGSTGGVGSVGIAGAFGNPSGGFPNNTYPNAGVNSQTGGAMGTQIQSGGQLIQSQNGQRPLTPEQLNPALDVIQRLLTQPRPPPPGVNIGNQNLGGGGGAGGGFGAPITNPSGSFTISGSAANGGNGQFGGGGIAGIASKHEGRGIKLINDRDRIEEWEFIYDYGKDRGGRPNANTQSQQANGQNGGQGGFGNLGGAGQQSGGNQRGGAGQQTGGMPGQGGQGMQGGFGNGGQGGQGGQGGFGQGNSGRRP